MFTPKTDFLMCPDEEHTKDFVHDRLCLKAVFGSYGLTLERFGKGNELSSTRFCYLETRR